MRAPPARFADPSPSRTFNIRGLHGCRPRVATDAAVRPLVKACSSEMARLSTPSKTIPLFAINLGTVAVFVAWLVVAGYAFAYLTSH
jgi:hypothetical protein